MKKALILAAVLGAGLSTIFLLPPFKVAGSAMSMDIPAKLGGWTTTPISPSEQETTSLAKDTRFSKANCEMTDYRNGQLFRDEASLSIVLSGEDLTNSIHRPERCMEAQGHQILAGEKIGVDVRGQRELPVRQLLSTINRGPDEKDPLPVHTLTYYFFVGSETLTEDHQTRNMVDMKDRLFKGQAQNWAYVLVSMYYKDEKDTDPRLANLPDRAIADQKVRELIGDIAAKNINWQQVTKVN